MFIVDRDRGPLSAGDEMTKMLAFIAAIALAGGPLVAHCRAAPPCDFKGIAVGHTMAPAAIMKALGVTKYKTNPAQPSFNHFFPLVQKYGSIAAGDIEDWKMGPYCDATICVAPYGVTVGDDNTPVELDIGLHNGMITEIDVEFSSLDWEELLPIWDLKYGAGWNVERAKMPIMDFQTKKTTVLERVTLDHKSEGVNRSTSDRCLIWATNLDVVFQHHDPLGPYHGIFAIKLVSKNF